MMVSSSHSPLESLGRPNTRPHAASDEDDSAAEIARSVQHKLKRKAPRNQSILDNGRFIYKKVSWLAKLPATQHPFADSFLRPSSRLNMPATDGTS